MSVTAQHRSRDWVRSGPGYALAWGLPAAIVLAGAFADAGARTLLWCGALVWMGTACLLNARRCGRTHCRYTGPFYLLLIPPVALYAAGLLPLGPWGWWILGALVLLGGKVIWWATETAWGRYGTGKEN